VAQGGRTEWRTELAKSSLFQRHRGDADHDETVRILAIDGGGIRGIIPALILAEIEERTGQQACELFDFIAGTSTGAILALGAATPGPDGKGKWKARDGVDLYSTRGREIFSKGKFSVGLFHEKYHHESFERVLDEAFGDAMLSDAVVRCMATAYSLRLRQVHHFDSDEAKRDPTWDFHMKTVIRAATAAPTFFEPARVYSSDDAEHLLLDGALYANNPAMIAFVEATRGGVERAGADDVVVVSLGTGDEVESMHWEDVKDWGLAQWARPILNVLFDAMGESIDYQLRHLLGPERYHRFQTPLDTGSHHLDDASDRNIEGLMADAANLLRDHDEEIDHLCEKLVR
jgi:patatin-like phospholipase/acyl hydrolase